MPEPVRPDPPRPPSIAPLELERLRGAVRHSLFETPAELPVVGRYTLLRCIGHGGMGIVYAARDEELGREVAIKLLRAELARADDRRLAEEARALARLAHPNVVCVFDVGMHEGQRFIAMEYVAGDDLRRWLGAPRTLRDVLRVFAGAGRGLHAAHTVGLVHRDFKPDNVLVGDDGRPRVLDFGLARPPDAGSGRAPVLAPGLDPLGTALTSAGQVLGTPAYMAPEQYLGEAADARSDQFSFAVALYHAVYGERPFDGEDPQALALSIVRGRLRPVVPRYPVPEWLERMLERALMVDAAQRFASMDALVAIIEAQVEVGPAPELDALPNRAFVLARAGASELSFADPGAERSGAGDLRAQLPAVRSPEPSGLAVPPDVERADVVTSLSTRRTLPHALSEAGLDRITRELDRLEKTKGKVVRLGAGLTWSTRTLEVHVDPGRESTEILVWRRLSIGLRIRSALSMGAGFVLGMIVAATLEEILALDGDAMPIVLLITLVGGAVLGLRTSHRRHAETLPPRRAQLEFVADRLVMLALAPDLTRDP
jgi:predicted Ser/Thr protein kinase